MWFLFALLGALLFSLMWVFAHMSKGIPPRVVNALEFSLGPLLLAYAVRTVDYPWSENWFRWYLVLPFVVLPFVLWGLTYAVQQNPITVIKPLSALSSISALIVSLLFFGDELTWVGISGIIIITAGLISLFHGRWDVWNKSGPWIALVGSLVLGANVAVVAAVLSRFPHVFALSALALTGHFVGNSFLSGKSWKGIRWTRRHIFILLFLVVMTVSQDLITLYALTLGPAPYVIAVKRTSVLITAAIGYAFLQERDQSLLRLLCSSIVVVLGVVALTLG